MSEDATSNRTGEMPFLAHLEELRTALIRSAKALGIGMIIACVGAGQIMELLSLPLVYAGEDPAFLEPGSPFGGISVAARVVMWSGLILSGPFIVVFMAGFVAPGLYSREKSTVVKSGIGAVVLFALGALMGFRVVTPEALRMMEQVNNWFGFDPSFYLLPEYVSFVLRLTFCFGVAFELPVIILLLGHMGLVNVDQLRDKRNVVIIVLLLIGMLLTPPDPYTQLLMAVPMCLLYEACIWIMWFKERAAGKRDAA